MDYKLVIVVISIILWIFKFILHFIVISEKHGDSFIYMNGKKNNFSVSYKLKFALICTLGKQKKSILGPLKNVGLGNMFHVITGYMLHIPPPPRGIYAPCAIVIIRPYSHEKIYRQPDTRHLTPIIQLHIQNSILDYH